MSNDIASLLVRLNRSMSWREIACLPEFENLRNVSAAPHLVLSKLSKGIEPTNPNIRQALYLPVQSLIPVCPTCQIVHTKPCHKNKKPRAWRSLWDIPQTELKEMIMRAQTPDEPSV